VNLHRPTLSSHTSDSTTNISLVLAASAQGLTLAHFSAQLKRFLLDKGCVWGLFRGCLGAVWGCQGVLGSVQGVFLF
jgi:hypothetical protein